jgi:hypothetical protein
METANDRFNHLASYFQKTKGVYVTTKETNKRGWQILNGIWKVISFGQGESLLTNYTTTIADTIYFPLGWKQEDADELDYITLCHELKHVERYRTLGLGSVTLGFAIFLVLYLFLPLPILFAWFRYAFEREAYLESYEAAKRVGLQPKIDYYVKLLTGKSYLWAWPFKLLVRRWFMKRCT